MFSGHHDVGDSGKEPPSNRSTWVESRKIICVKSLLLE